MTQKIRAEVRLQSVIRRLFDTEWDGYAHPLRLTAIEQARLATWRGRSISILPIRTDSHTPMPPAWVTMIGTMTEQVSDALLTRGLRIAAHGHSPADRPWSGSGSLGPNAALKVLREVIAFGLHKTMVSQQTLEVWDDYDLGLEAKNRRAPSETVRAKWVHDRRMERFADWLRGRGGLEPATQRRARADVGRMTTTLGLTPTTGEVDGWLAGEPQARRLRWAWQQYVLHCTEWGDPACPDRATPAASGRPSLKRRALPPPEVCEAIRVLASRFTVTGLHRLRAGDCVDGTLLVATSAGRKEVTLSAEETRAAEVVRAWAANDGDAALVPRRSGETGGMSLAEMKRVIAEGAGGRGRRDLKCDRVARVDGQQAEGERGLLA